MDEKIGRYELKRLLGRGGMASVFLAHDPSFDREIAIKVLREEYAKDKDYKKRFKNEKIQYQ